MILPIWLSAWKAVSRYAPAIVAGVLIAALLVQHHTIATVTGQRDLAAGQRDRLVTAVTDATVPADAKGRRKPLSPDEALAAAQGLARDRDDARAALGRIGRDTAAARTRSAAADVALARAQAANAKTFAQAAPRIAELATTKPSGDQDQDAAAIDTDSHAPWEGWR